MTKMQWYESNDVQEQTDGMSPQGSLHSMLTEFNPELPDNTAQLVLDKTLNRSR